MVDMGITIDAFSVGFIGILGGLILLIYGVLLTAGQSLNMYMVVGGIVILIAMALMTFATAMGDSYGKEFGA
jgi:hypothetical protein